MINANPGLNAATGNTHSPRKGSQVGARAVLVGEGPLLGRADFLRRQVILLAAAQPWRKKHDVDLAHRLAHLSIHLDFHPPRRVPSLRAAREELRGRAEAVATD